MMRHQISIRIFWMVILFATASGQDPCEPRCEVPNTNVIDPRDCKQYYFCYPDLTFSATPEVCQRLFFNPLSGICDSLTCLGICGRCHLTCDPNLPNDIIADVNDCSVFYECDGGVPVKAHTCPPETPYFDGTKLTCVNNSTACCNPGCNPHCEPGMSIAPDPANCRAYYYCLEDPPHLHRFCSGDQVFDIGAGECSTNAKCEEWCYPGGGGIITTTTTQPPDSCLTSWACTEFGQFPMCPYCDPNYFYCEGPGYEGVPVTCSNGMTFNPVPDYFFCVLPDICPYYPLQ